MSAADLRLVPVTPADKAWLEALYIASFPPEERAPFSRIWKRILQKRAECSILADGEEKAGFAYVLSDGEITYLFFFAVASERRGQGYGTAALKMILERHRDRNLFLALEPWDDETAKNREERLRRHDFYLRCGLRDIPGRITEVGYSYAVMSTKGPVDPGAYQRLFDRWLGWPKRWFLKAKMTV